MNSPLTRVTRVHGVAQTSALPYSVRYNVQCPSQFRNKIVHMCAFLNSMVFKNAQKRIIVCRRTCTQLLLPYTYNAFWC